MKLCTSEQRKKLLEAEVSRIVAVLKRDYEPERVILFGSLVEGDMHERMSFKEASFLSVFSANSAVNFTLSS